MVSKINIGKSKFYQCEDCKLPYLDRYYAQKCEEWCKKNKTCNIEITKHSVKMVKVK